ncbi:hypothetical protein Q1695_005892 [Nippostrongylus brasiliensis]|nr:hypothetical protein Q1695_005892 [Nippostrongylus brasiliensis]
MKHLWLLVVLVAVGELPISGYPYPGLLKWSSAFAAEDEKADKAKETKENKEANVCELELETGPCRAAFRKYGYSKEKKSCVEFIYGGCSGNGNNFETLEECKKACP